MNILRATRLVIVLAVLLTGTARAVVTGVCSFEDGGETLNNPAAGYAGGGWATLSTNQYVKVTLTRPMQTKLWSLQQFSKGYVYNNDLANYRNYVKKYCGEEDRPLNDTALRSVRDAFASCRAAGGAVIPRFAYTWDGHGGCEPDDFEMVLTHIRQLAEIVSEYADVIPAVECGIIGAYGEMHTSRYTSPEYANRIIGTWLKCTPASVRLLIRSCPYIVNYFGAKTKTELFANAGNYDQTEWKRIGFYNDGYLGTDGDYGTWGGGSTTVFTREEGIDFLEPRSDVPYGGEFATVTESVLTKYNGYKLFDPALHNLVEEWYRTHLSYLRTFHATDMTIYQKLKSIIFQRSLYESAKLPDLHEYEGVNLMKFAEDHAGARYVVRSLALKRGRRLAQLDLGIENTGFGELPWEAKLELLIVGSTTTYRLPIVAKLVDSSFTFELPVDMRSDTYRLYLRVALPLKDETEAEVPRRVIKFANEGAYDATLKANYLCSFTYDAEDVETPFAMPWFATLGEWTKGAVWEALRGRRVMRPDFASPVGHFVRWSGRVEVAGLAEEPELGAADRFAFAFVGEEQVEAMVRTAAGWRRLEGWTGREGETVRIDLTLDLQAAKPTAMVAIDGQQLAKGLVLPEGMRQMVSIAFGETALPIESAGYYWSVLEEMIELPLPELSGLGGGLRLVGSGEQARFELSVANPVSGAYYTTFVTTTLAGEFVAEGVSVRAEGTEPALKLSVTAKPAERSKFVRVVVSSTPIAPGTRYSTL